MGKDPTLVRAWEEDVVVTVRDGGFHVYSRLLGPVDGLSVLFFKHVAFSCRNQLYNLCLPTSVYKNQTVLLQKEKFGLFERPRCFLVGGLVACLV